MTGNELLLIIRLLAAAESGWDDSVVTQSSIGPAVGRLQITMPYISCVNRHYQATYIHADAKNPDKARHIALRYLWHYGQRKRAKTGTLTVQDIANLHRWGPNGWKRGSTSYSRHIESLYNQHKEIR